MRTLPQKMVQKMALVLILLFSDPGNGNSFGSTVVTDPPVDTTGCYGGIATFYCESNRSDVVAIGWLIGSHSITELDKETHGITINNDNSLSIMGLPINNGISIGCTVVVSTPPYVETKSATFTVIEIPSVEYVNVDINNDIMTCTWSQPSCVPVNHCYHVNINNESLIVTNTTTIQYPVSFCQSYNVSVTVMDTIQPQYQSETVTGTVITGFFGALDFQLDVPPLVTFRTINECNIYVSLKINLTSIPSCPIMLNETFTQLLPPSNDSVSGYTLADRLMSFNTTSGTGWFDFGSYNETLKGNCQLSPQTDAPTNTLEFNISTFNVQNFSITPLSDGTTNITCVFADNSFADGCNVVFTIDNITKYNITIPKSDKDNATTNGHIVNGLYDVDVYDVYDVMNGVTGQYPAYTESDVHITHYIDRSSTTDSSTAAIAPSITTKSLSSSISSPTEPTVAATNPVINPTGRPDYTVLGGSIGGAIVLLLLIVVIVIGLIVFRKKCVRYEDGKHSLRVRGEQALVRKPRANQHNYVDPVAIQSLRTQSPFIHNNEESEYFQHPFTFLQGARRNSSPPPPPPTFPPPDYNQISETELSHPYTVTEDIHESSTNIGHTTFVSQQLSLPTQDTSTINGSTDTSSVPTESIKSPSTSSSEISNSINQQLILEAVNKYNFEQRSNEPNILGPHNAPVAPLPKPIVRVPEGPKLQEGLYAELQLEGYQRPFQRIPEDPVAYLSVTKKDVNTLPPIPPKPQQQQSIDIVQKTHKGNYNVIQFINDDNDDYTTESVVVASDTESDHVIVMDKFITIGGSVEDIDGTRTSTANPMSVVVTGMPVWKFSTNNCQIVCSTFIKEHSFSETDNDIITVGVSVLHETSETSGSKKDQLVNNTISMRKDTDDQQSVNIKTETEKESKYSKYDKPRNNNNVIRQFIDWACTLYFKSTLFGTMF